jgi:hypothetical protein
MLVSSYCTCLRPPATVGHRSDREERLCIARWISLWITLWTRVEIDGVRVASPSEGPAVPSFPSRPRPTTCAEVFHVKPVGPSTEAPPECADWPIEGDFEHFIRIVASENHSLKDVDQRGRRPAGIAAEGHALQDDVL